MLDMARTLLNTPSLNRLKRLSPGLALLVAACIAMQNVSARGQNPTINEQTSALDPRTASAGGMESFENSTVINFSGALTLAEGRNPQIGFANQQINEAFAQLKGAKVLWLPTIRAGVSYINHDGPLQNGDGTVPVNSRSAVEAGLGMYAVGGGAPAIPGLSAKFGLSDAVFQPHIAANAVAAKRHAARTATHDILLSAAVAYLDLLRAFQQKSIAEETLKNTGQLAELTTAFARTGQGNQADADRAQTELALRKNAVVQAAAQTKIASARLAEVLNLDPTCVFVPEEPTIVPIELVSHDVKAAQLVADGLSRRPELAESHSLVEEAVNRLNREQYAPLLPSMLLDVSQSSYGGGPGSTVADFSGRFDFDATAYWELRNFGLGEAAARAAARSRLQQARLSQVRQMDRVAREIVEANTQALSLREQVGVAQSGILVAGESYRRNVERIRGGQGLPIEVLQSIQALDQSRREYLRAVGDYDEWQFRLYRALGCPIPCVAPAAE
jgi:outer membrane protein TolC